MCGLFGIGFQKGNQIKNNSMMQEILKKLAINTMSRGKTASGVAFSSGNEIVVLKSPIKADELVGTKKYKDTVSRHFVLHPTPSQVSTNSVNKWPPTSVMGHCRFKTKGSESDNANNHPIVYDDIIGTHNGTITNDDFLFKTKNLKRNGQVDSEVIFALISSLSKDGEIHNIVEAIKRTADVLSGSFSCVFVHRAHPFNLWFFRGRNPCKIVNYEDRGVLLWASEMKFIEDAAGPYLGKPTEIKYDEFSCVLIDLFKSQMYKFEL